MKRGFHGTPGLPHRFYVLRPDFRFAANAHDLVPPPRTVSTSGEGEISVKPDRARLVMGVDKLSPEIKTAETEVNKVVRAYVAEAKTLGAKLGPVRTVSSHDAGPPPPVMMKAMEMRAQSADGNTEMGISLGEIRYRATVSAEFDLLTL